MLCDPEKVADLVPVDMVINLMLVSAWNIGTTKSKDMPIPVYNCSTGRFLLFSGEYCGGTNFFRSTKTHNVEQLRRFVFQVHAETSVLGSHVVPRRNRNRLQEPEYFQ